MLSTDQVVGIALASVVLIAVPGPSVMFVVGRAITYGRRSALGSVVGNAVGCYGAGVVITLGLGVLLQRFDLLFQIIKYAGVCYLIYLGVQAIRRAGDGLGPNNAPETGMEAAREGPWAAARVGILVGLTNPKTLILFTAIVPQFIDRSGGRATSQMLMLGLVPIVIGLVTDASWAMVAGRARTWLATSPRRLRSLGRLGGASVIGVGISLAFVSDKR